MSTLYLPGDASTSWQPQDSAPRTDAWAPDPNVPVFLPVTDYDAGRRDGIMIGLILGAISGSVIVALLGFFIFW